jgi:tetratricopeptide (TPR) repeat protein
MIFGEPDSACAWWLKALSFRPDFASTEKLETYYLLKRNFDEVRKYIPISAASKGVFQEGYVQLVTQMTNVAAGRVREAYENLRKYGKSLTDDKYADALIVRDAILTLLAFELGDVKAMKENASLRSEILHKSPLNKVYGRDLLAIALAAGGETAKSTAMLEEIRPIVERDPRTNPRTRYYYALGMLNFSMGKHQAAVTAFEKSLAMTIPNHAPDYFYAVSLLKSNQLQAAVAELRRLTVRSPIGNSIYDLDFLPTSYYWPISAIKSHYWLGIAYEQQGEASQAMKEYETFLDSWKEADFDSKELKDAKARLAKLKAGA